MPLTVNRFKITEMNFDRRIKGKLTECLVQTLLDHAGYRIVPMGVEHIIREVKERDHTSLYLPQGLRTLPDFLITDAQLKDHWLLEVKYRQCWNEATVAELGCTVEEQVKPWGKVYLLLFLGEHFGTNKTPASQCRIFTLRYQDSDLHYYHQKNNQLRRWRDIQWEHGHRIQEVFPGLNDTREEDGIRKCCNLIRQFNAALTP